MTGTDLTLRRADQERIERVETVLDANDLPSRDVRADPARFFLAFDGDEFVGVGGLERYDADGLLRSVVVTEGKRERGYGTALCDALERRAQTAGVTTLYLLTTTAAGFFRRRGYESVSRERAPSAIRETTEFAELCPASATCLRKRLLEA